MNRYTIITGVAIAVIAMPFIYSGLNIYAADQLQYRWDSTENFSFFVMSNGGHMEFCNTSPVWTYINNFQVDLFYDMNNLGTFMVDFVSIEPSSTTTRHGSFQSDEFISAQHVFMTIDYEFDGGDIRLDPTKMYVMVTTNTPILGLIPYTTSTQYTGFGFDGIMNGDNFEC